ncbi:MAG: SPFH domain-containing protein [Planctomycetota bacterium]
MSVPDPPVPAAPVSGPFPEGPPSGRRRAARSALEAIAGLGAATLVVLWWINDSSTTGVLHQIDDNSISVIHEAWSDGVEVDDSPGYRVLRPWSQDPYTISKTPIEYTMRGNRWENANLTPRLAVRAADGSNFWFEEVRIQYAVLPERADVVLSDSGGDFAWHHGIMDAYARAVLRDALGRYTVEQIVLQENLRDGTRAAKERLTEVLEPHGLTVLELATTKAGFPKEYESVVQRRKVAEQEIQKIDQELEQLRASRGGKLAILERQKQREATKMRSGLAMDLADARRVAIREREEVDRDYRSRLRAGERARDEKLSEADALVDAYTKEAEGIRERADALAAKGVMAVRKALIEGLGRVEFEIAPHEPPPSDASGARRTTHPSAQ